MTTHHDVSDERLRSLIDGPMAGVPSPTIDEISAMCAELLSARNPIEAEPVAWPGDDLQQLVSVLETIEYAAHNDIKANGMKSIWDFARYAQGIAQRLRALFTHPSVTVAPEGWVMVPREPTLEMFEAGNSVRSVYVSIAENTRVTWQTMLAAAPALSPSPSPTGVSQAVHFEGIAKRKLEDLQTRGWHICGHALTRSEDGNQYGFITNGGFVGWWLPEDYPLHTTTEPSPAGVGVTDEMVERALAAKQSAFYGVPSGRIPDGRARKEMRAALEAALSVPTNPAVGSIACDADGNGWDGLPLMSERAVAWLIEIKGPAWWAGRGHTPPNMVPEWTNDATKAVRFCRREDAEQGMWALDLAQGLMRPTEHVFLAANPAVGEKA